MSARTKLAPDDQMTIEEFLAFTDTRPDGERWELIEGVAILNPSPVDHHQVVVANIVTYLMTHKQQAGASWLPMLGVGTRVPISPRSLPQPDVFVKETPTTGSPVTDDALVIFEVLSRSDTKADQAWRRKVYASVPNCRHYVRVSQVRGRRRLRSRQRLEEAHRLEPRGCPRLAGTGAVHTARGRLSLDAARSARRMTPKAVEAVLGR